MGKNRAPIPGPPNADPPRPWKFPLIDEMERPDPNGLPGTPKHRDFDAERKIMEKLAFDNSAGVSKTGTSRSDAVFSLVVYAYTRSDKKYPIEVCEFCRKTIPLFKKVFPNGQIVFTDQTGTCY